MTTTTRNHRQPFNKETRGKVRRDVRRARLAEKAGFIMAGLSSNN